MKKILFPTDFSENANSAMKYAINIADFFDGELNILNAYQVKNAMGAYKTKHELIRAEAQEAMDKCIRIAEQSLVGKVTLKPRIIKGNTIEAICTIAEEEDMDLIIMGTQGASGLKEIFLGSNASGVMTSTHIPVLAIPEGSKYHPLKQIIFPVDEKKISDYEELKPLLKIAEAYRANVKVLHLGNEIEIKKFDKENLEFFLKNIPHAYFIKAVTNDYNQVINKFTYDEDGDMICMIKRKRGFWESIFHKSTTTKEIFNSPVPLLVLRSPD